MTVPDCTAPSEWPADEHATCPCGGLMSFNAATGQLECDDCLTAADDAAVILQSVRS